MEPGSDHRLHHLLMDLARQVGMLMMDRVVPGQPLSPSQLFALHELDHEGGLSQRELAERLDLEKSTVSRLVADLESDGLLTRERDPANRRLYRVEITDAGHRIHQQVAEAFNERYGHWASAMTMDERRALATGLPALLRAMRADRTRDAPNEEPADEEPADEEPA